MNEKELTQYRQKIKIKLIKMDASMKDLADAMGISRQLLSNYLNQPDTYQNIQDRIDAGITKMEEAR